MGKRLIWLAVMGSALAGAGVTREAAAADQPQQPAPQEEAGKLEEVTVTATFRE